MRLKMAKNDKFKYLNKKTNKLREKYYIRKSIANSWKNAKFEQKANFLLRVSFKEHIKFWISIKNTIFS